MTMNDYYNKKFAVNNIKDLIAKGIERMGDQNLTERQYSNWLEYSQRTLELSTREYNPSIQLNYLRVIIGISPSLAPTQKIGICVEYLIGVLRVL